MTSIRSTYTLWPLLQRRLCAVVAELTDEQAVLVPAPGRWPIWATVGHIACQRVSWLCGFAGEPGAEDTPFPDALYRCPGDEDLEHVLGPDRLVAALDSTFAIVERCLDHWTPGMLGEVIHQRFGDEAWSDTRGAVIQRVFAHDIYHCAELNETFGRLGLPQVELWD